MSVNAPVSISDPASLSAQYLFLVANSSMLNSSRITPPLLSITSPLKGIARAIYTLGIAIVGPVGVLYHVLAGIKCGVQAFQAPEGDHTFKNRSLKHFGAAGYDFMAVGSLLLSALVTTSVVAAISFGFSLPALEIWLGLMIFGWRGGADLCITLQAAFNANSYKLFMQDKPKEGQPFSLAQLYDAQLRYDVCVRAGIAIDEPLTDEEANKIAKTIKEHGSGVISFGYMDHPSFQLAFELCENLKAMDKIKPEKRASVEDFLSKRGQIREHFRKAFQETAREFPGDTSKKADMQAASKFMQRLNNMYSGGWDSLPVPV